MGQDTKIEWASHTLNPWIGCSKVSDGCKNCYAELMMDHRYGKVKWGPNGTRHRTSEANWNQALKWNRLAKDAGVRHRVFCASLADVFEDRDELKPWRCDLFGLIELCTSLDWLLLTKRPENIMGMLDETAGHAGAFLEHNDHVWLGTSVENQEAADKRIPELLKCPAVVRFLSMEPLLGSVDLSRDTGGTLWIGGSRGCGQMHRGTGSPDCPREPHHHHDNRCKPGIEWVIVGGESGQNARPMHPDWARSIRDQCVASSVPFFFKQWGEWGPGSGPDFMRHGGKRADIFVMDDGELIRIGKHKAGRLLDGRTWDQFPALEVSR